MVRNTTAEGRDEYDPRQANLTAEMLPLVEEAHRLWVWSGTLAGSHFASHKLWLRLNALTSGAAAVIAAATGVTALADQVGTFGVGMASLATAVLASMGSLARASDHASSAREAGNLYASLRDDCRQFVLIDALRMEYDTAREALAGLSRRYHEANGIAEPPMAWPHRRRVRQMPPQFHSYLTRKSDGSREIVEPHGADLSRTDDA